ncbi:MAG: DUF6531 domain-containing protein, partial [Actinomycetota bacterium]|nr:DUF6531 domain-containing protein [Actinomycetota bacterium]
LASSVAGLGASVSLAVSVCDGGLGLESWWSYASQDLGAGGTASVNVANGNLVVQQVDSTPVQGHGRLGYVLRRTYNSQDNPLATSSGSIGAGWQLNMAQTGDLAGSGITPIGLSVPSLISLLNPLSVTLIDRDGTHHVYSFNSLAATLVAPAPDSVTGSGVTTLLTSLLALSTPAARQNVKTLCLDTSYTPPPGVHLDLWRYVGVPGASCAAPGPVAQQAVLGFSAVRPDRIRYDFSVSGLTVDMIDGSGNAELYSYDGQNRLSGIAEAGCGQGTACRSTTLGYGVANEVDVVDPAGRTTKYVTDGATPAHLVKVVNPDASTELYRYGGCGGTADQLCAATDPRGQTTNFTYTAALLGPGPVATMVDRNHALTTTFTSTVGQTLADRGPTGVSCAGNAACQRTRYKTIDTTGRVGEIDEGNGADSYVRVTLNNWDAIGGGQNLVCTNPAPPGAPPVLAVPVDNELCSQTRQTLDGATADTVTSWTFGAEGETLSEHRVVGAGQAVDTTWGYHIQYVEANGTPNCLDVVPTGAAQVSVGGPGCGARRDASTLYALADKTAMVTPRGNVTGPPGGFAAYRTLYRVDNGAGLPNQTHPGGSCGPAAAANTGNVCQVDAPAVNGTAGAPAGIGATTTQYSYDAYGQKSAMTSPKAVAEGGGATSYTYYSDAERDLSGNVTAGGWLKAVTDPTGRFVAYGYD